MEKNIVIRPVTTLNELEKIQQLETEIWQMDHPVPTHQLLISAKNGGVLLGAYDGELLVGLLYSFPGYLNGEAFLYSHMMGIKAGWRSSGIGERLKLEQASMACTLGYRMITWTYDPLETANGYLNIGKLGAVCSTYIVNCYGEMNDLLNQGLPSDRFQVEWWVDRPRPQFLAGKEVALLNWRLNSAGLPVPEKPAISPGEASTHIVPVPAAFQDVKKGDIGLAKEWRQATREVFADAFAAGWVVAGFRRGALGIMHEYVLVDRRCLDLPDQPWRGDYK